MDTYVPLTKVQADDKGNQMIVCRWYGTDMCQIHKPGGCINCEVFKKMLEILNAFEDVYKEVLYEKYVSGNAHKHGVSDAEDI